MTPGRELLAACWTTAGDAVPYPDRDASPIPLETRIATAAEAGFVGFGLMHVDLAAYLRDGGTFDSLRDTLATHGMKYTEVEFLTGWWQPAESRAESDAVLELLVKACVVLRPHHVKIGPDTTNGPFELKGWAESFARVCDSFASVDTQVALEFMPFSNVPDLATALQIVHAAGRMNGGLMLDAWHLERSQTPLSDVAALPLDVIKGVELNDGLLEQQGDGYDDTVLRRRLCGFGEFRIRDLVETLDQMGWVGPLGVEILSETYRVRPVGEAVKDAFDTTMAALA